MGHKARESEKNAITVAYCLRFDSRPRMGSDRHRRVAYGQPLRFNSRSRMGSDVGGGWGGGSHNSFNSRSRMGSDCRGAVSLIPFCGFNSRSRMGSDWYIPDATLLDLLFQFTLPHGERHLRNNNGAGGREVSIHAPAWGATFGGGGCDTARRSFNSRSRMGSDTHRAVRNAPASCFNSRSRVGSDRVRACSPLSAGVSIHAPAWGATRHVRLHGRNLGGFQFTLPRGERPADGDDFLD